MTDISKLSTLLDNPEVRDLLFGLTHVGSVPSAVAGASRLRRIVLDLAGTTDAAQYGSWLSDHEHNLGMTVEQVRRTLGDGPIDDLAEYTASTPGAVAWQLTEVLPDLVDAVSPGGVVVGTTLLAREIAQAILDDERSAGAFG